MTHLFNKLYDSTIGRMPITCVLGEFALSIVGLANFCRSKVRERPASVVLHAGYNSMHSLLRTPHRAWSRSRSNSKRFYTVLFQWRLATCQLTKLATIELTNWPQPTSCFFAITSNLSEFKDAETNMDCLSSKLFLYSCSNQTFQSVGQRLMVVPEMITLVIFFSPS